MTTKQAAITCLFLDIGGVLLPDRWDQQARMRAAHDGADTAQVPTRNVLYVENTPLFAEVAAEMGIRGILHTSIKSTRAQLASCGLRDGIES